MAMLDQIQYHFIYAAVIAQAELSRIVFLVVATWGGT